MLFRQLRVGFVISTFLLSVSFAQADNSVRDTIYSKLHCCACKETFAQCVCQEAKEMKAYIEAFLETGVGKEEIYYKVAKKYSLNVITDPQIKAGVERRLIDEAGAKRPQLVLEPQSVDFGQLHKHQGVVKRTFEVSNKGTDKLVIRDIKTSCACVTASLKIGEEESPFFGTDGAAPGWQAVIDPGKAGELEVAVDLQHASIKPGKFIREVYIFSNDPLYPQTSIMFVGNVEGDIISEQPRR